HTRWLRSGGSTRRVRTRFPVPISTSRNETMRAPTPNELTERSLAAVAAAQRGLFTHAQAIRFGWSESRLDRRERAGRIERVHHRVYSFCGVPHSWEWSVHAAVLAAGPGAAA